MRLITGMLATLLVVAGPYAAGAQERSSLGFSGAVDYTRMTDDESFLGSGPGFSGGMQWHLTRASALEVEVGREHHVRDLGLFAVVTNPQGRIDAVPYTQRWEGNATFVLASVSHAFGSGLLRPVVWGGGGLMFHDGTTRGPVTMPVVPPGYALQPGDASSGQDPATTTFAFDSGAGVEARVSSHMSVRPFTGLRLANSGGVGPQYILRFGVSVSFRP